MNSYHDYHIYGYEVDSVDRRVTFRLGWPYDKNAEKRVILNFFGVFGYELTNDSMTSIVLDFEEIPLRTFLNEYGNDIRESFRQNGAYGPWAADLAKAEVELESQNVKAIVLSSSIGMEGWLLAQAVEENNA